MNISPIDRCGLGVACRVHRRAVVAVFRPNRRACQGERLYPSRSFLRGTSPAS